MGLPVGGVRLGGDGETCIRRECSEELFRTRGAPKAKKREISFLREICSGEDGGRNEKNNKKRGEVNGFRERNEQPGLAEPGGRPFSVCGGGLPSLVLSLAQPRSTNLTGKALFATRHSERKKGEERLALRMMPSRITGPPLSHTAAAAEAGTRWSARLLLGSVDAMRRTLVWRINV